MTKQRYCFVTQVGDALEALASALDPEREPPFKGDILDLLEWAAKDVKELHADIDQLRLQLAEAQAQSARRLEGLCKCGIEKDQLRQQLDSLIQPVVLSEWQQLQQENDQLREQVTLLRSTIHKAMGTCFNRQSYERCLADPTYFINVALAATEPKDQGGSQFRGPWVAKEQGK